MQREDPVEKDVETGQEKKQKKEREMMLLFFCVSREGKKGQKINKKSKTYLLS